MPTYGGQRSIEQDLDRIVKRIMTEHLTEDQKQNIGAMLSMIGIASALTPVKPTRIAKRK